MTEKQIDLLDCIRNQNIRCPYCGEEEADSWVFDFDSGIDVDIKDYECNFCNKKFMVTKEVEVTYTSRKLENNG